ncbi:hypothetical protein IMG5_169320 [Ichthyophthirius multifiliis]|uniref:Uncharacterized protein n=1 Tax=Ichthyophthirius multifiliis TaxID=5932 RepID=G0R1A2_ICHMU|nr:hypothetical protein IMG5_169320 [Ichthyophthirius multifiliis]EGR28735.1 hypothetical protein IMG5_169320 [Ichthyophthirius multifiliis]|eukprot:XP_004029971.1 hypothetical protein IMG5_169320 [Ichthyophthirius multifiliis]
MQKTFIIILLIFIQLTFAAYRKYYQILGVNPNASDQEIKKAYRRLSVQYHPDKNKDAGATEKYQQINTAYEVLKDKDLRRAYDQEGEEGVKRYQAQKQQGNSPDMDFFGGIFGNFFGGGNKRNVEKRGPELKIKLYTSLEDIYSGNEVPFFITKQVLCPHCRGTGANDPDDVKTCPACNGGGYIIRKQQIAPGYYQQFQAQCDRCSGKGKILRSKCQVCQGQKTMQGYDEMSVFIERGIEDGQTIKFEGGGDDYVDMSSSDIIFEIKELAHPVFERKKNNLHVSVELTLREAIFGFKKKIKHLDNHFVKINKVGVTQPGEIQKIVGEGMPLHQQSQTYGDLYIQYKVRLEKSYTSQQLKKLEEFFSLK